MGAPSPSPRAVARLAGAHDAALSNADLVALILGHVDMDPRTFISVGLVSKAWRATIRCDAAASALLLAAARSSPYLTKTVLMGLFGLTSAEASCLPHDVKPRLGGGGGVICMYREPAIGAALPLVGLVDGWRRRLAVRAQRQASVEQVFGSKWRELQHARVHVPHRPPFSTRLPGRWR